MSLRVLVVAEDPKQDKVILKPLAEKLLKEAGKPGAKVVVLENPRLRGYDDAVRTIREVLSDRYRQFALWLFFPDADCATRQKMEHLEKDLQKKRVRLFCCPAQPEVEIYACVGFRDRLKVSWKNVREHDEMKEQVFEPLAETLGYARHADGGRKMMIEESLKDIRRLFELCPETKRLRDRIAEYLEAAAGS